MRLSELSTDRALDVLCDLTPYVSGIASDEAVIETVGKVMDGGEDLNRYGQILLFTERIGQIIPLLLKTHRADVYGILSVMNEKEVSEIAGQNVLETIRQAREVFQDKELLSFFKSSAPPEMIEPFAHSVNSPASA